MTTLDPFLFEVLRHRLWTINVEGALALQRVSGSPLATEAFDMNTSIMTADGEVAFAGPYLLTGPLGQGMIARHVIAEYGDNPGIEPGDMFLCNDPWVGAAHQNCVTLVGPVHAGGELVAWCGATLHLVDLGGPQSGQVGVGAGSVFEEAPVIPPLKVVAGGRLLRDVEAAYLRRSRTPELNALDLRGKIAALNTISRRVGETAERYGTEAVRAVLAATIERSAEHLRGRLAELPDGRFEHTAWLDGEERDRPSRYAVRLDLEKRGERLLLDFRGSSPQAPAVVNCTRSALVSGAVIGVLACLVDDAPWCPAGVERAVEIASEPGTVVDATWPAGCSMATMAAGFAVTTATTVCLGELLAASDEHRHRAMAAWAGAVGSVDVFGRDQHGRPFGTVLLDSMASGTGARAWADGIDTGGFIRSMACVVANVEQYEARYPLLYLYRRQEADTGGPGRFRGGTGVAYAVTPHGVDTIDAVIPHFSGTEQAESVGLDGGYPGATNATYLLRRTGVRERFAAGRLPTTPEELGAEPRALRGVERLSLAAGDVFAVVTTGGGGWGDPLERPPAEVAADVRAGLVSAEAAAEVYGVPAGGAGRGDGDPEAARARAREGRAAAAARPAQAATPATDGATFRCRHCGHEGPASALPHAERPMRAAGPHMAPGRGDVGFVLREHYCPNCWRLLAVRRLPAGSRSASSSGSRSASRSLDGGMP